MTEFSLEAYHGTTWERPFAFDHSSISNSMVYDNFSSSHSDLDAVYFSDNPDICNFFGAIKVSDPENQIQALVKVDLNAARVYEINFKPTGSVVYGDEVFDFPDDRPRLYEMLREDGYQAVVTKGDYINEGKSVDDIAILDDDCIRTKSVQLLINGNWTPWLEKQQATRVFEKWSKTYDYDGFDREQSKEDCYEYSY